MAAQREGLGSLRAGVRNPTGEEAAVSLAAGCGYGDFGQPHRLSGPGDGAEQLGGPNLAPLKRGIGRVGRLAGGG